MTQHFFRTPQESGEESQAASLRGAAVDAAVNSAVDAGVDVAVDSGVDAAVDSGVDSGSAVGSDQGVTRQDLIDVRRELVEAMTTMKKAQACQRREHRKIVAALEKMQALHYEMSQKSRTTMGKLVADAAAASQEESREVRTQYSEENCKLLAAMDKRIAEVVASTREGTLRSQTLHFEASQKILSAMDARMLDNIAVHKEAVDVYRGSMARAVSDLRSEISAVSGRLWLVFGALLVVVLIRTWS